MQKVAAGVTTQLVYDRLGHLLEEANDAGTVLRDYVWFDNIPVAMVDDTGSSPVIYYIHTDQLGTPQKMTDGSANIVWDNVSDPFGNAVATQGMNWDAANWGSFNWAVTMLSLSNLRFPGQYFDAETGLSQNWNREYDSTTGRYVQSDPAGLVGGPNTYTYVTDNPLIHTDSNGLQGIPIPPLAMPAPPSPGVLRSGSVDPIDPSQPQYTPVPGSLFSDLFQPLSDESCKQNNCPPCRTVSGRVVPVGTIAFRPMDTPDRPQHGITGPHYNIYKANQNPRTCRCFWQPRGAVAPADLPLDAIPIEPFAN